MMDFFSEDVRTEFHLLPIDKQTEFTQLAERLWKKGMKLKIIWVDRISEKTSEVLIGIDEEGVF